MLGYRATGHNRCKAHSSWCSDSQQPCWHLRHSGLMLGYWRLPIDSFMNGDGYSSDQDRASSVRFTFFAYNFQRCGPWIYSCRSPECVPVEDYRPRVQNTTPMTWSDPFAIHYWRFKTQVASRDRLENDNRSSPTRLISGHLHSLPTHSASKHQVTFQ